MVLSQGVGDTYGEGLRLSDTSPAGIFAAS